VDAAAFCWINVVTSYKWECVNVLVSLVISEVNVFGLTCSELWKQGLNDAWRRSGGGGLVNTRSSGLITTEYSDI